eukprot:COSAG05_NODE_5236_length_1229_cov_1.266372_3_plen_84_part_01
MEVNRVPELYIGEVDITSISELGETVDGLSLPIRMVCGDTSSNFSQSPTIKMRRFWLQGTNRIFRTAIRIELAQVIAAIGGRDR